MDKSNLKSNKPQIDYDDIADVLYISFGKPRPGIANELSDGNFVRKNPKTDEIVGITILDFMNTNTLIKNDKVKRIKL